MIRNPEEIYPFYEDEGYFMSGTNHPGEIRALALSGNNIGISVPELKTGALEELELHRHGPTKVFVDSGAFTEVGFGPEGIYTKKPITHDDWVERLAIYEDIARWYGPRAYLVAPDKIAHQEETLTRLDRYALWLFRLGNRRANIIVPIQKGQLPMHTFWKVALDLVPVPMNQVIAGIPMKKDATSLVELTDFVREARPARIHLLGLGPRSPRYAETVFAIRQIDPEIKITSDSVRITALVGRRGRRRPRPLTAAQDEMRARGILDPSERKFAALQKVMFDEYEEQLAKAKAMGWRDPELEEE